MIGPEGILGTYRKAHLPFLGIDRFDTEGDVAFPVFETAHGKIGVNICFDCNFPEAPRVLKLKGEQLLAIPTNWPEGTNTYKYVVNTRGQENHMFVVASDRVGVERGFRFTGHSKIVDTMGETLAEADGVQETILYAEVELAEADKNRVIRKPGEWEYDRIGARRPEFYGALIQPKMVAEPMLASTKKGR